MKQLITINDVKIQKLMFEDQPVVTIAMIAKVHGVSIETVRSSYRKNRERFKEGKHVFRLDSAEANQLGLSVPVSRKEVIFPP